MLVDKPNREGKKYLKSEDEHIRKYINVRSDEELGNDLGRSARAVRKRHNKISRPKGTSSDTKPSPLPTDIVITEFQAQMIRKAWNDFIVETQNALQDAIDHLTTRLNRASKNVAETMHETLGGELVNSAKTKKSNTEIDELVKKLFGGE